MAARRRLRSLRAQLVRSPCPLPLSEPAAAAQQQPDPRGGGSGLLSDAQVATFVKDGLLVLPNLVETGELSRAACDEIYDACFAIREEAPYNDVKLRLFRDLTPHLNTVLGCATVRGAMESVLGPGYFMPAWNTHMHANSEVDGGFHADGTDHGPTQTTVRDHRPRQVFGFFYPSDVPLEHGPTAVVKGSQYKAVDRVDPASHLHSTVSEDHLHSDALAPSWGDPAGEEDQAAADEHRMAVASEVLGEVKLDEVKLTCRAGTVVLVHHDVRLFPGLSPYLSAVSLTRSISPSALPPGVAAAAGDVATTLRPARRGPNGGARRRRSGMDENRAGRAAAAAGRAGAQPGGVGTASKLLEVSDW